MKVKRMTTRGSEPWLSTTYSQTKTLRVSKWRRSELILWADKLQGINIPKLGYHRECSSLEQPVFFSNSQNWGNFAVWSARSWFVLRIWLTSLWNTDITNHSCKSICLGGKWKGRLIYWCATSLMTQFMSTVSTLTLLMLVPVCGLTSGPLEWRGEKGRHKG